MENTFVITVCDFCGAVEYRKKIGEEMGFGGFAFVDRFEPSQYQYINICQTSYTLCPQCSNELAQELSDRLKKEVFKYSTFRV